MNESQFGDEKAEQKQPATIPTPSVIHESEDTTHSNHTLKTTCETWKSRFETIFRFMEVCTFIAVIITTLIIYKQLQEMQKTRTDDERAWVLANGITSNFTESNSGVVFYVSYKNTGKTPALRVQSVISWAISSDSIPKMDGIPDHPVNSGLCAPDSVGKSQSAPIPIQIMEDIINGKSIYVYGTAWYDDIFGHHHWSQFCYEVMRTAYDRNVIQFNTPAFHNSCDDAQETKGN